MKEINKNFLNLEKTFFEEEASDKEQELIIDLTNTENILL
jgi:hypothetical protein